MAARGRNDLRARARETLHGVVARPRHVALAALVAGLLVAPAPRWIAVALAAGGVLAGVVGRRPALGLAAALATLTGALVADARLKAADRPAPRSVVGRVKAADRPPLRPLLGRAVDVRADALEPVRRREFGGWSLAVRASDGPL